MSDSFFCGRRGENPLANKTFPGPDKWEDGSKRDGYRHCSYCGSMNPDDLFKCIEEKTCEISGTDKNYKIYVQTPHPRAGEPCVLSSANFEHTGEGWVKVTEENVNTLPLDDYQRKNYNDGKHWVKVEPRPKNANLKFYFQHFNEEHMKKFVELYNAKQLPLEPRFGLYRMPYFMRPLSA